MPLLLPTLTQGVLNAVRRAHTSPLSAASAWATAYANYTSTATFGPNLPVFTGLEETRFKLALLPAMSSPFAGTPSTLAAALTQAVMSFWLAPPVPVVGPVQAGTVLPIPGLAALPSVLTSIFSVPTGDHISKAASIASALDAATRTITCTVVPPPGTILPIL